MVAQNGGSLDSTRKIDVKRSNAKKLAAGYTQTKRCMECFYFTVAVFLWCMNFAIVARYFVHSEDALITQIAWSPCMIICAILLADFIGGVVHWGFDTWGTPETPFFGNFIRSFREHHVNLAAITKHDFIETNADTMLPLIPGLLLQSYFLFSKNKHGTYVRNVHSDNAGKHVFFLTFSFFMALTNEVHKWAHQARPPAFVRPLRFCRVVLTPSAHMKHHRGNHDRSYCITTGWMNWVLDRTNFWRRVEEIVTAMTGALPRDNDTTLLNGGKEMREIGHIHAINKGEASKTGRKGCKNGKHKANFDF